MKNIKYILLVLPFMFMTTSCEDFLNINTDPDNPTALTLDQALPPIIFYAAQMTYDHAEYGVYLAQALTTAGNSQTGGMAYSSGWEFIIMNRHPQWRRHFFDIGMNNYRMLAMAEAQGARNYELIGRTIRLMSTMLTTDVFGDMPLKEAWQATSPRYCSQDTIYAWMFREVDELIALYRGTVWTGRNNNSYRDRFEITREIDRIYGGDMTKWGAFTEALRVRLWIRKLPNWENTTEVANRIIAYATEVLNNPNWQEPRYHYPGGPTESNAPWGPLRPVINAWESRPNRLDTSIPTTFFAHAILGAYERTNINRMFALDPRATMLMTPRTLPAGGGVGTESMSPGLSVIRHLESNIGMDASMRITNYPNLYAPLGYNPFTRNTGYIALMLQEELMFIKAEAQFWAGDRNAARETAWAATRHNMHRLTVLNSPDSDGSCLFGTPGHPNYRNSPRERFDRFYQVRFPAEFTIAHLMQQKYVAMYLQPEQWTDMRRYNFSSATNGITYDGVAVYTVVGIHNGLGTVFNFEDFFDHSGASYSLRRPFNLFTFWTEGMPGDGGNNFGTSVPLSPNAWIHRLNYDPETEERYNARELERLGAFRNRDWLRKRMIWAENRSGKAHSADPHIPWMQVER